MQHGYYGTCLGIVGREGLFIARFYYSNAVSGLIAKVVGAPHALLCGKRLLCRKTQQVRGDFQLGSTPIALY